MTMHGDTVHRIQQASSGIQHAFDVLFIFILSIFSILSIDLVEMARRNSDELTSLRCQNFYFFLQKTAASVFNPPLSSSSDALSGSEVEKNLKRENTFFFFLSSRLSLIASPTFQETRELEYTISSYHQQHFLELLMYEYVPFFHKKEEERDKWQAQSTRDAFTITLRGIPCPILIAIPNHSSSRGTAI